MDVTKTNNMSYNSLKQRRPLYNATFLKWSIQRRLSTFEQASIESTLSIHKFGNEASQANFDNLCESLSDLETMIEVAEESFPALRGQMDVIKKHKLKALKKQTEANKLEDKAKEIKEKALNLPDIIKQQEEQAKNSKGIKRFFKL